MKIKKETGFTLIELIVVVGIIAILSTIVILVINPAQIFSEARDAQRIADLSATNSALTYYLFQATFADMDGPATGTTGGANMTGSNGGGCKFACWVGYKGNAIPDDGNNCFSRYDISYSTSSNIQQVDGTGWIPVDLTSAIETLGLPLSKWPLDPISSFTNKGPLFYTYACDNEKAAYELNAKMESQRFSSGGISDTESSDGGSSSTIFEIGNDSSLDL